MPPPLPRQAEKKSPEFTTTYKSTEQDITVKFTTLEIIAHSDAILNVTEFADTLVASLDTSKETATGSESEDEGYLSEEEKKPKGERVEVKFAMPSELANQWWHIALYVICACALKAYQI